MRICRSREAIARAIGMAVMELLPAERVCAVERVYSDAVDRLGMKPGDGIQERWEKLIWLEARTSPITEQDAYFLAGLAARETGRGDGSVAEALTELANRMLRATVR